MKHKFLTKNTKITINEVKPNGLKTAEKVYDEDGKINKKSLNQRWIEHKMKLNRGMFMIQKL